MVIKLSDYVLEQSISDASINDIELEQLVAEMDVCCKLAMAYNKQLLMESYFQEQDPVAPASGQTPTQEPAPAPATQQKLPQNLERVNNITNNQNTANNTNSEQGFFKSIAGYIKRFFQWIGSKLTGVSADAVKNIAFIERYALNASEQQIVQFIRDNNVNIEWYDPNKLKGFVRSLASAAGIIKKSLNNDVEDYDKSLETLEEAMNNFNEIIQQSSWTQPKELVDEVNEVQTFKTNITGYAELFKARKNNPESFADELTKCNGTLTSIQKDLDVFFSNANDPDLAKAKPVMERLRKIITSASVQINKIAEAYKKLKQFAIDISKQLEANPNDANRGKIEKAWVTPQNVVT